MKKIQMGKAEKHLANAFKATTVPIADHNWHIDLMGSVRRAAAARQEELASFIPAYKMMWKLAVASVVTATVCLALYAFTPDRITNAVNDTASNYDSFENAASTVAQL